MVVINHVLMKRRRTSSFLKRYRSASDRHVDIDRRAMMRMLKNVYIHSHDYCHGCHDCYHDYLDCHDPAEVRSISESRRGFRSTKSNNQRTFCLIIAAFKDNVSYQSTLVQKQAEIGIVTDKKSNFADRLRSEGYVGIKTLKMYPFTITTSP